MLAYQRRNLSDALAQPLVHRIFGIDGSFWFGLAAESVGSPKDDFILKGKIYIYLSKGTWRAKADKTLNRSIKSLNSVRLSTQVDRDTIISKEFSDSKNLFENTHDIGVRFLIERTGEVYFTKPIFRDKQIANISIEHAKSEGYDLIHWVANQAFFFLRDISHRHQHHSPSSDTIMTLQIRDPADLAGWRRNIIYSLQYYIIRTKRFYDNISLARAMGLLGYCASFYEISNRRLKRQNISEELPRYNDNALIQSLSARLHEATATVQHRADSTAHSDATRALLLTVTTIFLAVIAIIVQPAITKNYESTILELSKWILDHLFPILLFGLFIILPFWIGLSPIWKFSRFHRDVFELANVRRVRVLIFGALSAVAIAAASFWLGAPAVESILGRL